MVCYGKKAKEYDENITSENKAAIRREGSKSKKIARTFKNKTKLKK